VTSIALVATETDTEFITQTSTETDYTTSTEIETDTIRETNFVIGDFTTLLVGPYRTTVRHPLLEGHVFPILNLTFPQITEFTTITVPQLGTTTTIFGPTVFSTSSPVVSVTSVTSTHVITSVIATVTSTNTHFTGSDLANTAGLPKARKSNPLSFDRRDGGEEFCQVYGERCTSVRSSSLQPFCHHLMLAYMGSPHYIVVWWSHFRYPPRGMRAIRRGRMENDLRLPKRTRPFANGFVQYRKWQRGWKTIQNCHYHLVR
jgi:hypothetical protein